MSSTIKQAIESLRTRIAAAYTSVQNKGGTLPATQDSANLPTAIASIPTKQEEAFVNDINFIDPIDGCIASYSLEEFAALTEMPTPKTHDKLTFESWCTCEKVSNNIADYQDGKRHNIGALYYTTDGCIYIKLRNAKYFYAGDIRLSGGGYIDFGDGVRIATDVTRDTHYYQSVGDYEIKIYNAYSFNLEEAYDYVLNYCEYIYMPNRNLGNIAAKTRVITLSGAQTASSQSLFSVRGAKAIIAPNATLINIATNYAKWIISKNIVYHNLSYPSVGNGVQDNDAIEINQSVVPNAFQGGSAKWVRFGDDVTTLPSGYYFVNYVGLDIVDFGKNIATIPTNFMRYNAIREVYLRQQTLPTLTDSGRNINCISGVIVHVSASVGIAAYNADTNWAAWIAVHNAQLIADLE